MSKKKIKKQNMKKANNENVITKEDAERLGYVFIAELSKQLKCSIGALMSLINNRKVTDYKRVYMGTQNNKAIYEYAISPKDKFITELIEKVEKINSKEYVTKAEFYSLRNISPKKLENLLKDNSFKKNNLITINGIFYIKKDAELGDAGTPLTVDAVDSSTLENENKNESQKDVLNSSEKVSYYNTEEELEDAEYVSKRKRNSLKQDKDSLDVYLETTVYNPIPLNPNDPNTEYRCQKWYKNKNVSAKAPTKELCIQLVKQKIRQLEHCLVVDFETNKTEVKNPSQNESQLPDITDDKNDLATVVEAFLKSSPVLNELWNYFTDDEKKQVLSIVYRRKIDYDFDLLYKRGLTSRKTLKAITSDEYDKLYDDVKTKTSRIRQMYGDDKAKEFISSYFAIVELGDRDTVLGNVSLETIRQMIEAEPENDVLNTYYNLLGVQTKPKTLPKLKKVSIF